MSLIAGVLAIAFGLVLPLAGCGSTGTGSANTSSALSHVTLGLTYVPNIQFAPFYVAEQLGYYKQAGLDVTLHHHSANEDEFSAVLAGQEDAIFAGGDEVAQARAKSANLVYIGEVFREYPVTLIVPANSPIHSAADLRGHSIGVPGEYGATYIGLLALLHSAGLSTSDVNIQSIGYTQIAALTSNKVDAVMGYINNEAVQLEQLGTHFPIRTIQVTSVQPMVSNGLAATSAELKAHPDEMRALVAATMRGVEYTLAHPQDAVNISKNFVPGLSDPNATGNANAVLAVTNTLMQLNGAQPGYSPPADWQSMVTFLEAVNQLPQGFDTSAAYSNAYLPSASSSGS